MSGPVGASPTGASHAGPPHAEQAQGKKKKRKRFKRFFNFAQVGDGCGSGDETVPNIWFFPETGRQPRSEGEALLGDKPFAFCYAGFAPDRSITWQIDWPDGRHSREVVKPDEIGPRWDPEPGVPLGRYEVVAQQGSARATGSLTVKRPARGVINAVEDGVRVGRRFRLALVAFPPDRRVQVAVYRASERPKCPGQRKPPKNAVPYCLTGKRFSVRVDAQGDGVRTLIARRPAWRPSSYVFAARDGKRYAVSWGFSVCPPGKAGDLCIG